MGCILQLNHDPRIEGQRVKTEKCCAAVAVTKIAFVPRLSSTIFSCSTTPVTRPRASITGAPLNPGSVILEIKIDFLSPVRKEGNEAISPRETTSVYRGTQYVDSPQRLPRPILVPL